MFSDEIKYLSCRRLPVVICIDDRIAFYRELNVLIEKLIHKLIKDVENDTRLKSCVEFAFVSANSSTRKHSSFSMVMSTDIYSWEHFTSLSDAIEHSYDLIIKHIKELAEAEIGYYTPMIIILGASNDYGDYPINNNVVEKIQKYCDPGQVSFSDVVIPVFFAIGEGRFDDLEILSNNYLNAIFPVDKTNIDKVSFLQLIHPTMHGFSLDLQMSGREALLTNLTNYKKYYEDLKEQWMKEEWMKEDCLIQKRKEVLEQIKKVEQIEKEMEDFFNSLAEE